MSLAKYKDMIFAPRELSVLLADGLVEKGHEVFFFTAPGTKTKAAVIEGDDKLIRESYIEEKIRGQNSERFKWASFYNLKRNYELDLTEKCYKMALKGNLDIVHSYHDTLAHFFDELTNFPTVYTLHDPLPTVQRSLAYWLFSKYQNHNYISISNAFRKHSHLQLGFIDTVYHGLNHKLYQFSDKPGSYLAFAGRMVKEKGLDEAIAVSEKTKIALKVATSTMLENQNTFYYNERIKPILDSSLISFVGFMNPQLKSEFFKNAQCLLFPIKWEEPFGMVMIEAMACGTPVVAYNRGSVSEIVRDGKTGFIVNDEGYQGLDSWIIKKQGIQGLIEAVQRIGEIDRAACRKHIEENFTIEKMVKGYEEAYKKILNK